ncbi:hypothetical protein M413DRAFT_14514 [Hebeloma cylindrosporum]|uniref:Uncharacterized protein n=1 Tax=Hebeloma cylindrosporum TaxID=76867 RepID=A0A0C2XC50_HEBCY|nr:hypothetical protein M413DRAFT_14514 [Hebeloma cylindrosporum h7]
MHDYPKVIKSGIDEEGQHPKSPNVTGPNGIATLLHRISGPELLERLLDVSMANEYNLRVRTGEEFLSDLYVKRRGGLNSQIGFIDDRGKWAQPGVRYRISPEPKESPFRIGKWVPLSTSIMGSGWGGTDMWIREQGAAVAKAICDLEWNVSKREAGSRRMVEETSRETCSAEEVEKEEYSVRKAKYGANHFRVEEKMAMQAYHKWRMACRAGCACQSEDLMSNRFPKSILTLYESIIVRHLREGSHLREIVLDQYYMQYSADLVWARVYDTISELASPTSHSALKSFKHTPTPRILEGTQLLTPN